MLYEEATENCHRDKGHRDSRVKCLSPAQLAAVLPPPCPHALLLGAVWQIPTEKTRHSWEVWLVSNFMLCISFTCCYLQWTNAFSEVCHYEQGHDCKLGSFCLCFHKWDWLYFLEQGTALSPEANFSALKQMQTYFEDLIQNQPLDFNPWALVQKVTGLTACMRCLCAALGVGFACINNAVTLAAPQSCFVQYSQCFTSTDPSS